MQVQEDIYKHPILLGFNLQNKEKNYNFTKKGGKLSFEPLDEKKIHNDIMNSKI